MTAIKINAQVICRIAGIPGIFSSHAFFSCFACLARGYHAAIIFSTASTSLHLDLAVAAAAAALDAGDKEICDQIDQLVVS